MINGIDSLTGTEIPIQSGYENRWGSTRENLHIEPNNLERYSTISPEKRPRSSSLRSHSFRSESLNFSAEHANLENSTTSHTFRAKRTTRKEMDEIAQQIGDDMSPVIFTNRRTRDECNRGSCNERRLSLPTGLRMKKRYSYQPPDCSKDLEQTNTLASRKSFGGQFRRRIHPEALCDVLYVLAMTIAFYLNYGACIYLVIQYSKSQQIMKASLTLMFTFFSVLASSVLTIMIEQKFYQWVMGEWSSSTTESMPAGSLLPLPGYRWKIRLLLIFACLGLRPAQRAGEVIVTTIKIRKTMGETGLGAERKFLRKMSIRMKYHIILSYIVESIVHCTPQIITQIIFRAEQMKWTSDVWWSQEIISVFSSSFIVLGTLLSFLPLQGMYSMKTNRDISFICLTITKCTWLISSIYARIMVILTFTAALHLHVLIVLFVHWVVMWIFVLWNNDMKFVKGFKLDRLLKGLFSVLYMFTYVETRVSKRRDVLCFCLLFVEDIFMALIAYQSLSSHAVYPGIPRHSNQDIWIETVVMLYIMYCVINFVIIVIHQWCPYFDKPQTFPRLQPRIITVQKPRRHSMSTSRGR